MYSFEEVMRADADVAKAMDLELGRQRKNIELIASENFVSKAVMAAMGSPLTNKYAEGYPGKRYYGGCECVDIVENLAIERAKELYGCTYANVQPHSGAQANMAVFFALLQPGDTVLVFGLGAIGLFAAMIMKTLGAGTVIGADRSKLRIEQVRKTGLLEVVDTADPNWLEQVKEMTAREGVDIVVEATGAPPVLQDAFTAARTGGRIVVPSVYFGAIDGFEPLPIMRKELTIVGSKGPAPQLKPDGTSAVLDKVIEMQDDLRKVITVYDYKDALQAFADARSGAAIKAVVKF